MGKRTNRAKRSLSRLPKGLPVRGGGTDGGSQNPFEVTSRQKRPKHQVHNRNLPSQKNAQKPSALAEAVALRKRALKEQLRQATKSNTFKDGRIGEGRMTADEQNLARLVRERAQRSKRNQKYSLEDGEEETLLTHKGQVIGSGVIDREHVILDEKEEDLGNLDEADTSLHFGSGLTKGTPSPYGPTGTTNLSSLYSSRKSELDDLILRRKIQKAEKQHSKEIQAEAFQKLDEKFDQLAHILSFRDKEQEIRDHISAKRAGSLTPEDQEYEEWDLQMKKYQYTERKVKATDRTKTPEEMAKEEADRLHQLETRRLARMNGDFEDDDFSDIEDESSLRKRRKIETGPEGMDDPDTEEGNETLRARFTADGLVSIDKDGNVVEKIGEKKKRPDTVFEIGTKVIANYRVAERLEEIDAWYEGTVSKVSEQENGEILYDIDYDDGDFEEGVLHENVKLLEAKEPEVPKEEKNVSSENFEIKRKRELAKEKARSEIPFVFEVPTTLDALHDIIAQYASTGEEASLIIKRIHSVNSVRLNRQNAEKIQNFYDVLLKRFVAVGNAVAEHGDGGSVLGRLRQLDEITKVLYRITQEIPDNAAAVWGRRLGILENAHSKRLRDSELELEDDSFSAWPSLGEILLLRAVGHLFPPSDMRHTVMTPVLLFLSQLITQTPIESNFDLTLGVLCAGIIVEYTKEARRVNPEVVAFLSSAMCIFSDDNIDPDAFASPNVAALAQSDVELSKAITRYSSDRTPMLSLSEAGADSDEHCAAILFLVLDLAETLILSLTGFLDGGEKELLLPFAQALVKLKSKSMNTGTALVSKISSLAKSVSRVNLDQAKAPLKRRAGLSTVEKSIKSLAPRMQNPDKISMSKDKGKSSTQAAADRTRRELKRDHKAISRELRLDSAFVERERREQKEIKDSAAKAQRNKAYAWLEGEQAAMNQQVRQGGGLIKGGGMGAARAKAATAKLGIKKGGKFKS